MRKLAIGNKNIIRLLTGKINVQYMVLIVFMVLLVVTMQISFPLFLTAMNIESLAMSFVFEAIVALGMTMVIITGGIDLSVSSVFPFAEIIAAKLMVEAKMPIIPSILITLAACCVIGALNGALTDILKVNPMIITMGMMLTLRGVNLTITKGSSISGFSDTFIRLGQGKIFGINIPIIVFIILAIIIGILLNNHKYFRQIYFIGGNEKAARLSGVNVRRVKIFFYILCSFLAGISGILGASKYGAAQWAQGSMMEMKSIAAVAIGGASLYGGSGTIFSTVLGVIFLAIVNNAFVMSGINTFWYDIVNGGMLILAVLLSIFIDTQNKKRLIKKRYEIIVSQTTN